MALVDRPQVEKLKAQTKALLLGFEAAGARGLTTRQLLTFSYLKVDKDGVGHTAHLGDWRSRKSELKKAGYTFDKHIIEGSEEFRHVLTGFNPDLQLNLLKQED